MRVQKRAIPIGNGRRGTKGNFVVGGVRVQSPFQKPVTHDSETTVRSPMRSPFQRTEESKQRQQQRESKRERKRQKQLSQLQGEGQIERARAKLAEYKGRQRRAKHMGRRKYRDGARTWWI